jgi:hypothetical protein
MLLPVIKSILTLFEWFPTVYGQYCYRGDGNGNYQRRKQLCFQYTDVIFYFITSLRNKTIILVLIINVFNLFYFYVVIWFFKW